MSRARDALICAPDPPPHATLLDTPFAAWFLRYRDWWHDMRYPALSHLEPTKDVDTLTTLLLVLERAVGHERARHALDVATDGSRMSDTYVEPLPSWVELAEQAIAEVKR